MSNPERDKIYLKHLAKKKYVQILKFPLKSIKIFRPFKGHLEVDDQFKISFQFKKHLFNQSMLWKKNLNKLNFRKLSDFWQLYFRLHLDQKLLECSLSVHDCLVVGRLIHN
ncbi:hypothetical protein BpHYR1_040246 [Brachionus plicatilis]|uniref:Uncharacterized protein n=1 Tax=Brachionus plicatilis TaxID=10195 RepID=A0A3M7PNU2_BRAPC|nr:hypothetical protein BpHYR1_040246 [Brachionus plicatilis]